MSTKITWKDRKAQTETQTHPFTEADFKRPFVLKLKLQGNTEVTFCHFLPSTCCPTVVSCQGDFHSHRRKPPSKVISCQGGCVQTSCQYILLWTISLRCIYKGDILSSYARLTIIAFDSFFICSVESRFPISLFFNHFFLSIPDGLTEHTSSVSASPCFTFTQWRTLLSWELSSTSKLLSSSTGADGIKGKGCSVTNSFL